MANWRYRIDEDIRHYTPWLLNVEFENEWMIIRDCIITVKKGYAWDGCSPSLNITSKWIRAILPSGIWLGIWDGPLGINGRPVSWRASLLHDVVCQFRTDIHGLTKENSVKLFKHVLHFDGAPKWLVWSYSKAVSMFGPQDWL